MSQLAMFQLTDDDQRLLLQVARNAVRSYLLKESPRLPEIPGGTLAEAHGIFVSIHTKNGELRGCIGNIHPVGPLLRSAAECAIAAAVGDPRFMPLMIGELDDVEFEISVLSPMQAVHHVSEIEVGRHGLLISRKGSRGLLLPQVATTYGWDRERFLAETCRKAGLNADAWKDGATIQSFSAVVFAESRLHFSLIS
jgi:AmmeMemoRadiSam system protein A